MFLIVDLVRAGRANLDLTPQAPVAGATLTAGLVLCRGHCHGRLAAVVRLSWQAAGAGCGVWHGSDGLDLGRRAWVQPDQHCGVCARGQHVVLEGAKR